MPWVWWRKGAKDWVETGNLVSSIKMLMQQLYHTQEKKEEKSTPEIFYCLENHDEAIKCHSKWQWCVYDRSPGSVK